MEMTSWPSAIWHRVDQMVVSVGPYIFHSEPTRGSNCCARSSGSASPPHRTFRSGWPGQPVASSKRQVTGVACITVTRPLLKALANAAPSAAVSRLATITRAPTISGRKSSRAAMSKDKVVMASNVSSATSPGCWRIDIKKLTTARCRICTPLGRPVDPEV